MAALRVLSVASEVFPLVKTGGLADVAGALPHALTGFDVRMRTLLPAYPAVLEKVTGAEPVAEIADLFGGAARLLAARDGSGLDLMLLDAPHLFARAGNPYVGPGGVDWPDNPQRFAALSWVAAEIGLGRLGNWRPDVVHVHDWQAALAPAYLALSGQPRPGTVITVHNLAFQGQFPAHLLGELRLPASSFTPEGVEYYGSIGFLKAGLNFADRLTTVSPTYAREIQTTGSGMGLDGLMRARADRLTGIVNGIDTTVWNPASDPHLAQTYSAENVVDRIVNKRALRLRLGLADDWSLLFCVITRLTWQKGMDLLLECMPGLLAQGGQLALLGSGDPGLESAFADLARGHPGRVGCFFGYDESLSHLVQGGADAILVPSRFEPCGLTQLYGLRYGCVPVVSKVGGLADTVIDANDAALADGVATGVQFSPVTAEGLADAIARTFALFEQPELWATIQHRGMTRDVGWASRAAAYARIYRRVANSSGESR